MSKRNEKFYQMPYVDQKSLEMLTDAEAGQILKALNRRRYTRNREEFSSIGVNIYYNQFCDQIDSEHDSYDEVIAKKKEGVRKRWDKEKGIDTISDYKTQEDTYTKTKPNQTETKPNQTETKPNQTLSLPIQSERGEEREGESFVERTIKDEDYMTRLAMNTGLAFEDVKIGVKMAENAFVMDGNYPKQFGEFKSRTRNYVQTHVEDINKFTENGTNKGHMVKAGDAIANIVAERLANAATIPAYGEMADDSRLL